LNYGTWEIHLAEPGEDFDRLVGGGVDNDSVHWSSSIPFRKGARSVAVLDNIRRGLEDGSVTPAYVREHLAK